MSSFEENKQHVATQIKEIREQKGITKEKLAADVGISATALSNILKGNTDMKTSTLIAICMALEVFPGEILPEPSFFGDWQGRINKIDHQFEIVPTSSRELVFDVVLAVLDSFVTTQVSGGYVIQMRKQEQSVSAQTNAIEADKEYIANRIFVLKEHQEISTRKLSRKAGLSERALNDIAACASDMRMSSLISLCEALNVFPEEILPQLVFCGKEAKRFESVKNKLLAIPSELKEMAFTAVEAILDKYT